MDSKLVEAWFALCHRCKVGLADATAMGEVVTTAYSEPHRHYHTLTHIQHCLGLAAGVPMPEADRDVVEFALWFHDVVYDPRLADNEERSAELAQSWLADVDVPGGPRVAALIQMTAGHRLGSNADLATKVVHDVDLAILGTDKPVYEQYVRDIRAEYHWLSEGDFRAGREGVLRSFADQSELYALDAFAQMFGEQARTNVAGELAGLTIDE